MESSKHCNQSKYRSLLKGCYLNFLQNTQEAEKSNTTKKSVSHTAIIGVKENAGESGKTCDATKCIRVFLIEIDSMIHVPLMVDYFTSVKSLLLLKFSSLYEHVNIPVILVMITIPFKYFISSL